MKIFILPALLSFFVGSIASTASAQSSPHAVLRETLTHPDGVSTELGYVVAGNGSHVVTSDTTNLKEAFIYNLSTSGPPISVGNPTTQFNGSYDEFDLNDSYFVAGADRARTNGVAPDSTGRVYVFDPTSGALLHTLASPSGQSDTGFGDTVTLAGSKLIVGAWREDLERGSAYVYDLTDGSFLFKIAPPNSIPNGRFGFSVGTVGNDLLVSQTGSGGETYLFDGDDGSLLQTYASQPGSIDAGGNVAGSSTMVLIADKEVDTQRGEVNLYDASSGTHLRTINSPGPTYDSLFGKAIAINDSYALVSSQTIEGLGGPDGLGTVYIFDIKTGDLIDTVDSPTTTERSYFGTDLDFLDEDTFVVSTRERGAHAYVYDIVPEPTSLASLVLGGFLLLSRRRC